MKAAQMAAKWWADRLKQGDKAAFEKVLCGLIEGELALNGRCYIEVDYDPDALLLIALEAAGVECRGCMASAEGILPMKHSLWVFPDVLKPKEGYGNWTEVIEVDNG